MYCPQKQVKAISKLKDMCAMCKEEEASVTVQPCQHMYCQGIVLFEHISTYCACLNTAYCQGIVLFEHVSTYCACLNTLEAVYFEYYNI